MPQQAEEEDPTSPKRPHSPESVGRPVRPRVEEQDFVANVANGHEVEESNVGWKELNEDLILKGRQLELQQLKDFQVYEEVPWEVARGKTVITTRWVDTPKGEGVRSRFVARDYNNSVNDGLFAATPTSVATRLIDFIAARKGYVL